MTKYVIQGGHPLFGEVEISGAKNAAVAIIPAALMVDGTCRIENIPQISDVTLCLKILEQLGIPYFNFHMLRHIFATNCISRGFDMKTLSELLGHSNITTTMRIYVHSDMERKKQLMAGYRLAS